jgi:hypothetical protein
LTDTKIYVFTTYSLCHNPFQTDRGHRDMCCDETSLISNEFYLITIANNDLKLITISINDLELVTIANNDLDLITICFC